MKNIVFIVSIIFSICSASQAQTRKVCSPAVPTSAIINDDIVHFKTLVPLTFTNLGDVYLKLDKPVTGIHYYPPDLGSISFSSFYCSHYGCASSPGVVPAGTILEAQVESVTDHAVLRGLVIFQIRQVVSATPVTGMTMTLPNVTLGHTDCNARTLHYIEKAAIKRVIQKSFKKSIEFIP